MSPLRLAAALLRFGTALAAAGARLLAEAGRPDPIDLRPRVLHDSPASSGQVHPAD